MRWREHGQLVGGGPMLDYAPFDSIYGFRAQAPSCVSRAAACALRGARCEVSVMH